MRGKQGHRTRLVASLLLASALAFGPLAAHAQRDDEPPDTAYNGLVGIGAALGTLVYAPAKLTYALTGSIISGFAWVWTGGDGEVASTILTSAIGGDYVILPAHVEGERSLQFLGEAY